jgi:hypothetical protein
MKNIAYYLGLLRQLNRFLQWSWSYKWNAVDCLAENAFPTVKYCDIAFNIVTGNGLIIRQPTN